MSLYCDYNSTTPVAEEVFAAMRPYLEEFYGNPSSLHQPGQKTGLAREESRRKFAEFIGVSPGEVVFTGSGSEANCLAVRGLAQTLEGDIKILTTRGEHSSLQLCFDHLERRGAEILRAPLERDGAPRVEWFEENIDNSVDLISVMAASNETGVLYPVREIAEVAADYENCLFHVDAVQIPGKIPLRPTVERADLVSISAHKFRGPKGVGILAARDEVVLSPLVFGHQENEIRGGTENIPGIVGAARAVDLIDCEQFKKIEELRETTEEIILHRLAGVHITGRTCRRLPNTSGLFIKGVEGDELVMKMDRAGYYLSAGSACSSGVSTPSSGIRAVLPGADGYRADSFVRISLSLGSGENEVKKFAEDFCEAAKKLRHFNGEARG